MLSAKKITSLFLFLFIFSASGFSQLKAGNDISDQELQKFATAAVQIQKVNQRSQKKMLEAVKKENISVERFKAINTAQQDANSELEASDSEMQSFKSAMNAIQEIQTQSEQIMQQKIIAQGLTIDRYQEIAANVQKDKELQQKLQEYLPDNS